jgi:hypothetical protein
MIHVADKRRGSSAPGCWLSKAVTPGQLPSGSGYRPGGFLDGDLDEQEAVAAEQQAAVADGRMGPPLPAGQAGALAVEHMPPGPVLAGWRAAAAAEAGCLDEYGPAGWRSPPAG